MRGNGERRAGWVTRLCEIPGQGPTGLQGCVRYLAGQGPRQEWRARVQRGKHTAEEHGIHPHPDTQSKPWKVTASSTVRSSENTWES